MKEYRKLIIIGLIASFTILGVVVINALYKSGVFERKSVTQIETITTTRVKETDTIKKTYRTVVEIRGEVYHPGIYEFDSEYVLLIDLINTAGGLTPRADTTYLNSVERLSTSSLVVIGSVDSKSYVIGEGETLSKININTCTVDDLKSLESIGDQRASAIISYRKKNGFFESIEDILKVDGISVGIFEKIKDYITI